MTTMIECAFGASQKHILRFNFFFFLAEMFDFFQIHKFYFLATLSLKIGHTVLFIYLKIILL